MDKDFRREETLQERIQNLEAENERLYQIVRQLNSTLQRLIDAYIQPET